jgi:hypothetical protein
MVRSGELQTNFLASIQSMAIGLSLAVVFGTLLGLLMGRYRFFDQLLDVQISAPLRDAQRSADTPDHSLVRVGPYAKVTIIFLAGFFPIVINTHAGVRNVSRGLVEVALAEAANQLQIFTKIVIPASLPFIATGIRLAMGRAVVGNGGGGNVHRGGGPRRRHHRLWQCFRDEQAVRYHHRLGAARRVVNRIRALGRAPHRALERNRAGRLNDANSGGSKMKKVNREKPNRRAVVAGGLASAALAFAPKSPAIAQTLEKLVMLNGTAPPEPASHYFQYAIQNGFYKKHGVDLELRAISGTANALRATVAGEVDICWIDAWTGLQARDKGLKVKVLSAFCPKLDYSVVGLKEIKGMKELSKPFDRDRYRWRLYAVDTTHYGEKGWRRCQRDHLAERRKQRSPRAIFDCKAR